MKIERYENTLKEHSNIDRKDDYITSDNKSNISVIFPNNGKVIPNNESAIENMKKEELLQLYKSKTISKIIDIIKRTFNRIESEDSDIDIAGKIYTATTYEECVKVEKEIIKSITNEIINDIEDATLFGYPYDVDCKTNRVFTSAEAWEIPKLFDDFIKD